LCLEKLGNKLNSTNTTERVRDIRHTLWPLREVWLKVGLEKLESHEGVAVKALLDSSATGLFMDTTFTKERGFKMKKLKKPLLVRNVDGTTMWEELYRTRLSAICSSRDMWKEQEWTYATWERQS